MPAHGHSSTPRPPCNLRPLVIPPPPPRDRHFHVFFHLTCIVLVCVAHLVCVARLPYTRPCIAFPLLQIKHLCCSVILSLQRRCLDVLLLFWTQDVEDQFCEWLLPIFQKTSEKDPGPLRPPPPKRPSLGDCLPLPPGRPSCANAGDCKGVGGTITPLQSLNSCRIAA